MKRTIIIAAAAALAAGGASVSASAETLTVQGVIAPYCNVNLTNVSSGTASVAMANTQTIANLRLACNSSAGTKLVVQVKNGDLTNQVGAVTNRINYDLILDSSNPAFTIPAHDTFPTTGVEGSDKFTLQNTGFDPAIANGLALVLSLNMNVAADTNNTPTSRNYPATAAPAGTYSEVFTFTASSV